MRGLYLKHDLIKFVRTSFSTIKLFEIRIQDSPFPNIIFSTTIILTPWVLILDALNNFFTVRTFQIFFFFTAVFTDNVGVQARKKLARKWLFSRIHSELSFKVTLYCISTICTLYGTVLTSSITNFAYCTGTVLLSSVIINVNK